MKALTRKIADEPAATTTRGQPTPRRGGAGGAVPQTPARKTPAAGGGGVLGARTPGTVKKTPRGGVTGTVVATPHTARAVKQLQLTVGRSGGVRSVRNRPEIRRESQRDVLRALTRGAPWNPFILTNLGGLALVLTGGQV